MESNELATALGGIIGGIVVICNFITMFMSNKDRSTWGAARTVFTAVLNVGALNLMKNANDPKV